MVTLLFIFLNQIYHLLSQFKLKKLIKTFSFWINIVFLTIFQNCQQLLVLSLFHLFNVFSFNFTTKLGQQISLFAISIIFIFSLTIFPMITYFHQKKSLYFFSNISFTSSSWIIMQFQFVLTPGI